MKMRKNIELIAILMAVLAACLFTACVGGAMEELWKDELGNGSGSGSDPTPPPALGTYTVSFDMKGYGTQIDPITGVESGATITKPDDPTATGFNFKGWYKEAGCINEWNFSSDTVTADITLYAKWTQTAVSVTSVTLDKVGLEITVGDPDVQLTATVAPDDATDKIVIWSSNNETVATVDQKGNVHAVASGTATITVKTVDGEKTATCKVTVALPEGALAGKFTVAEGKKVHFSKGNLYYDGSAFKFETNQYDFADSWNASHVSHFYWSKTASVAYTQNYSDDSADANDVFFTNDPDDEESANAGFTVNDVTGQYRTLTKDEWTYLFNTPERMVNSKPCFSIAVSGVSIGGTTYKGVFIYPDNYNGDVVSDSMTWEQINAAGIVFLPAAGCRSGLGFTAVGSDGYYWSATSNNGSFADFLSFDLSSADLYNWYRCMGQSVRLVWLGEN